MSECKHYFGNLKDDDKIDNVKCDHCGMTYYQFMGREIGYWKKEVANLRAQVGVMRGALEGICRQADFTARAGGGKRRIATIPTGLNRQCNLERAIEKADYILSTMPPEGREQAKLQRD